MRFALWISRLPRGLEIPSWTFFNSPFRVDFKNVHFFIIWCKIDWDNGKTIRRGHFKTQHFLFILDQAFQHLWALMISHEPLCVLICTYEHSWACISSQELPWALISMVLWHCEHSWALMSTQKRSFVHMSTDDHDAKAHWALMRAHGEKAPYSLILRCDQGCLWMLMSAYYCSWVLISIDECSWACFHVTVSTHFV